MKTVDNIPTSKIQRASSLVKTGAKIGVNYLKYYGDKITKSEDDARSKLNENNAEDIYDSLSKLKGSTLKVAQMLSMEKGMLPQEYVERFSLAQFSVPPLSGPLVKRTFRKYFGKNPEDLFDEFEPESSYAASIGQVHKAFKDNHTYAVKVQYPGVADSIQADLKLVRPIAQRMFNLGKGKDLDLYFKEVEEKLTEETDYILELEQAEEVARKCAHIPNLKFPNYYKEFSCERIITMDWMNGEHISEFTQNDYNEELANKIGQTLWDFFMYQIHELKKVHADPHPGNFLVNPEGELIALDFGCMKAIPGEFYIPYFELIKPEFLDNESKFQEKMLELEIFRPDDTKKERAFFTRMFHEMITAFTKPMRTEYFNFKDPSFKNKIYSLSQEYSKNTELRKYNPSRGSKHFIYMNRTFFGLYNLMFDLAPTSIKIENIVRI